MKRHRSRTRTARVQGARRDRSSPSDRGGRPWATCLIAAVLLLPVPGCGAARSGVTTPLAEPGALAAEARQATGPSRAHRVELGWEYTDERGPVSGEGVLRYNPPDSIRLDLFGPGDGAMAVALAGSGLRSVGQIEDVQLPPPAFLYATAGLFRPGDREPVRGFRTGDGTRVLVYPTGEEGTRLEFRIRGDRLVEVESRQGDRWIRRVRLEWPEEGPWPASAEYRDQRRGSRARWMVRDARPESRFPRSVFDLPGRP